MLGPHSLFPLSRAKLILFFHVEELMGIDQISDVVCPIMQFMLPPYAGAHRPPQERIKSRKRDRIES